MTVRATCPAKLNTFLSVGPKDERGWHPLRTVFQAIDLVDELSLSIADRDELVSNVDWLPEQNSILRAVQAARRHLPVPPLKIELLKRIPAQAGLGGGSSDAAGVLRAIPNLVDREWPDELLRSVALELGADVPFFLVGGRAKGEGYGEVLMPLPDRPESFYLVVKPEVGCSTPEMYEKLDARERPWRDFAGADEYYNDFESVAPEPCHRAIELLAAYGAENAGLSGSGSAVFGRFPDHTSMLTAARLMRTERFEEVWPSRTLTREESLHVATTP